MGKFYEGMKRGLKEALAHTQGKLTLQSEFLEIPEPPIEKKAKDI